MLRYHAIKSPQRTSQIVLIVATVLLCLLLLYLAFLAIGRAGDVPDGTNGPDEFSFMTVWPLSTIHTLWIPLTLTSCIFALVIEYLGGRIGRKRFNDRSLESVHLAPRRFLRTAPPGAVLLFVPASHSLLVPLLIMDRVLVAEGYQLRAAHLCN
jgi:hypothetical protein